eukprot:SAG11_NODE_9103_length_943_cov_0.968009_1_plen_67_part_00
MSGVSGHALRRASISAAGVDIATDFSDALAAKRTEANGQSDWGALRDVEEFTRKYNLVRPPARLFR